MAAAVVYIWLGAASTLAPSGRPQGPTSVVAPSRSVAPLHAWRQPPPRPQGSARASRTRLAAHDEAPPPPPTRRPSPPPTTAAPPTTPAPRQGMLAPFHSWQCGKPTKAPQRPATTPDPFPAGGLLDAEPANDPAQAGILDPDASFRAPDSIFFLCQKPKRRQSAPTARPRPAPTTPTPPAEEPAASFLAPETQKDPPGGRGDFPDAQAAPAPAPPPKSDKCSHPFHAWQCRPAPGRSRSQGALPSIQNLPLEAHGGKDAPRGRGDSFGVGFRGPTPAPKGQSTSSNFKVFNREKPASGLARTNSPFNFGAASAPSAVYAPFNRVADHHFVGQGSPRGQSSGLASFAPLSDDRRAAPPRLLPIVPSGGLLTFVRGGALVASGSSPSRLTLALPGGHARLLHTGHARS
ncbi:hypothetical protein C7M84_025263 [Penaeus vannamei]|uniref:Uncharacterized protein n=1 Tax=Penaeus vannamei TaxID=6689 RepID=A0A423TYR9_PENVA|nr:hypothetical protein C7M84_025263 [Penaeus vannamei]